MRTLTRHEVLAAYPAKEMLLYGHWIIPMYAGIPRTAKPPGMNWLLAGLMKISGSESEFILRLPSALSGVATALMIASFAARHYGRRIAIVSALIVLTSVYVLVQARLAESDMLLVALVTAAMLIFASGPVVTAENASTSSIKFRDQLFAWQPINFYIVTGLTFLLKGGVGCAFILSGTIIYAAIQRDRRAAWFLLNPIGIVLFLALIAVWPVLAYLKYPAIVDSWRFEQVGRLTGERGSNPFYFYFYSIPGSLLPWTPLMLVPAWMGLKHHLYRRPINRFFLCWFIPGVILLSLSSFKHQHYAFPLLPPAAILAAVGLLQLIEHQRRFIAQAATIFAIAWIIPVLIQIVVIPKVDDYKLDADLARSANNIVPTGQTIFIIDPQPQVEPHSAWYLRQPIRRFRDVSDFLGNVPAEAGQSVYVITNTPQSNTMAQHGAVEILERCKTNPTTGKTRDLILVSYVPKR
ncbi:MAG TPA: glycosyltransferase family 39 protein [Tepidisphaeraceae bacterium]|nr:glycosyltransferase family 39 protein [Tepidisphaeraceae bacterium]